MSLSRWEHERRARVKPEGDDAKALAEWAHSKAWLELKDFNPREPRDPRTGEWTNTGGAPRESYREFLARTRAARAADTGRADRVARNNPASWSRYSSAEAHDMRKAVDDAIRRHPELLRGKRPLRAVAFMTGVKPRDISDRDYAGARATMASAHGSGITGSIPGVGSLIVMNDAEKRRGPQDPHHNVSADSTAYGLITHEIGHAYFGALGYDDSKAAEGLLTKFGISPRTDLIGYSDYGAASPKEALAELYTQSHTPGHSLPPVLAQKYQRLEAYASTHPVNDVQQPRVSPFLTSDPKLSQMIRQAAERNAEADAWVVRLPVLDG